jgi:protein translocase SecG subunit
VLHTFIFTLQIILTIALVVLMAVQDDKTDQAGGGVMGLGAAGGRTAGNIDLTVGAERILKPVTKWVAIGFLATSILNAVPQGNLKFSTVAIVTVIYLIIMLFGDRAWKAFIDIF